MKNVIKCQVTLLDLVSKREGCSLRAGGLQPCSPQSPGIRCAKHQGTPRSRHKPLCHVLYNYHWWGPPHGLGSKHLIGLLHLSQLRSARVVSRTQLVSDGTCMSAFIHNVDINSIHVTTIYVRHVFSCYELPFCSMDWMLSSVFYRLR